MAHGTLATLNKDGTPLGTYTSYVLEAGGQPLLRLRADAVHKANLEREPRCSLFVQPQDCPARMLARVTLIGKAELVDAATASQASELHRQAADGRLGVDAPRDTDQFYRLSIEQCFYVGGMGTNSQAEVISAQEFRSATPDILKTAAPELVRFFNSERAEDVMRIAAYASGSPVEQVYSAELLWVDRIGAYLAAERYGSERQIYRVKFQRPVVDERDARSVLTMLAQFAWEEERHYSPPIPEAIAA